MATTQTRPLPPELREKLAKLLPLLSSNHAGEQASALAAVGRLLDSFGLDWHDFTAAITQPAAPAAPAEPPPPRHQPPRHHDDELGTSFTDHEMIELVTALRASGCYLSPRSQEFLGGMLTRARRYRIVFVSPKQMSWLPDLAHKANLGM